ncbi:MAG: DUF507 family protein [Bryobacterales bacterium]|nr:DUF507 family protein [Bryobacterales bacterium]MDE0293514.1 DUF507 family protein [Bryobacterales bacterium]MDE0436708.1 DUF507 family protein [Bryobacterales bacterium]
MLLPRTFIAYLAREVARRLSQGSIQTSNEATVRDAFEEVLIDELSLEDEINAEARELLNQYTDYIRQERIPYQEMFWKVKRNILAERKAVSAQPRGEKEGMKISRDKIIELSHKLAGKLPRVSGVRVKKPWNEIRLQILRETRDILTKEEMIDQIAQEKIRNQKREIPEGSEEWIVLFRRYYEEEMKRYGIDLTPASATPV